MRGSPATTPTSDRVPRWARREMQQLRRVDAIEQVRPRPDGPSRTVAIGYGIGLGIRWDPRLGQVLGHSGGLPGYGSHMRWIPDRGIGVVALSNTTYGNMHAACIESLERLADLEALSPAPTAAATPAMLAAADRSVALVNDWRDDEAADLFADNAAMDEDLAHRAKEAAATVARHGPLANEGVEPMPPQRADVVAGGGQVRIELELNHERRVQWMLINDRAVPSDGAILTDPAALARQPRSAYVVLRPTADLLDAFGRWQGAVFDRLGGVGVRADRSHTRRSRRSARTRLRSRPRTSHASPRSCRRGRARPRRSNFAPRASSSGRTTNPCRSSRSG